MDSKTACDAKEVTLNVKGAAAAAIGVPEDADHAKQLGELKGWLSQPRFKDVTRPYTAEDVLPLRSLVPVVYPSVFSSTKAWQLFEELQAKREFSHTFGALDPVQVVQMAEAGLTSVYVSGWQCSSTASSTREVGPDTADYPMDTVPKKVDQLFRAQAFHARRQRERRARMTVEERKATPVVDYLPPIIADADTGHGGLSAVMRLTKLMIEAGAAGAHYEDQRAGSKKCGHQGGKVLVATREHINRLVAARLEADICGVPFLVVARTDAQAATLLDNNIDPRDHPFILGCVVEDLPPLTDVLESAGDVAEATAKWKSEAGELVTYEEAVVAALQKTYKGEELVAKLADWKAFNEFRFNGLANHEARKYAGQKLGVDPYWSWDAPRTVEGYYVVRGSDEMGWARATAFSPYCDLLWMETKKPVLKQAQRLVEFVRKELGKQFGPERAARQKFAYNLSPSFNWSAAGLSDEEIEAFITELGKLGFVWQFITLAGFHADGLSTGLFARDYAKRKMAAYVQGIQREEKKHGISTLLHQTWSGAEFMDRCQQLISGGKSSTTSMQSGSTEAQFKQ